MKKKKEREIGSPDFPDHRKNRIAKDRFEEKETTFQIKVTEKKRVTERVGEADYEDQLQNLAAVVGGRGRGALVNSQLGDRNSNSNRNIRPPAKAMDRRLPSRMQGGGNLSQLQGVKKLAPLGAMEIYQSNNNTVAFF
jgi:hypothetical protein